MGLFVGLMLIPFVLFSRSGISIPILEVEYASRREDIPLNEDKIRQNMTSKKGGTYSQTAVDQDIRNLYATGDYENVQILTSPMRSEDGAAGVRLSVLIDPRPILSEVIREKLDENGNVAGEPSLSAKELPLDQIKVGRLVGGQSLDQQAKTWEKAYRDRGYPDAWIQPLLEAPINGRAQAKFQIHEGPRLFIEKVICSGNRHVSSQEIESVLTLKPKPLWGSQKNLNCFDSEKGQEDMKKIADLFQNRGFLDVRVNCERQIEAGGLILRYHIQEGERYGVEKITVEGMQYFKETDLLRELREKSQNQEIFDPLHLKMIRADGLLRGRPYSVHGLQASIETLQNLYGQHGFREARISARILEAGETKQALRVHFEIQEGERSYVDRVEIRGNQKLPDQQIRSLILLQPGDVFDVSKEEQTKKNLLKARFLEDVRTYAEETKQPNRQILVVAVKEKPQELSFGLGVSYFWRGASPRSLILGTPFPVIFSFNLSSGWDLVCFKTKELAKKCFHLWKGEHEKG